MTVTVRSFAKINLGLCIGAKRADDFHELRTVYQTIGLHDVIHVRVGRGSGIEIRCQDPRVPSDETNTCYRVLESAMATLRAKGKVSIKIEKRLPVQGGLGGASSNAVATLLALQRALKKEIPAPEKLRMAAEVGSDLPLFLIGGTVLGTGRGEDVYPVPDLPPTFCLVATPEIGVSTPQAFSDWDEKMGSGRLVGRASAQAIPIQDEFRSPAHIRASGPTWSERDEGPAAREPRLAETAKKGRRSAESAKLTLSRHSDRMNEFSRRLSAWLSGWPSKSGKPVTGVPAGGRGRAESPLLDLVRTGIENDFERVVFPKHPELRDVKRVLEKAGAFYASLSGSGSAVYGLFRTREAADKAAVRLRKQGISAQVTITLNRPQYWRKIFNC